MNQEQENEHPQEHMSSVIKPKAKRGRRTKKDIAEGVQLLIGADEQLDGGDAPPVQMPKSESSNSVVSQTTDGSDKSPPKKRGRKPKGGKIVQQLDHVEPQTEERPNVILHLKCFIHELDAAQQSNIDTYGSNGSKTFSNFGVIVPSHDTCQDNSLENTATAMPLSSDVNSGDNVSARPTVNSKDIAKKLKQLEHNLHTNYSNKRSACFWDTCEFDNPPIYIPKHFVNGSYHVYGCFCSPECGVAYLMNENIDSSIKFERYQLFNNIYSKIYEYNKSIKPAPNPYYMLDKYYGNLSTQEYRSLLRHERLFLVIDKPLTRVLPELHEDNDDFILNNKIIPSNKYIGKTKTGNGKQSSNKTAIVNEKFGIVE